MPSEEIMKDYREHKLHSGRGRTIKSGKNKGKRRKGKIVKNKKQAKAILLSYLVKEGKIPARKGSKKKHAGRKKVIVKR
jgi:hypothetical protein